LGKIACLNHHQSILTVLLKLSPILLGTT